ncbi:hypothetical protein [Pseudoalteromonas ruthenica]|uniref:hypothetical protein n=1 Tax=Pseudoalteromonas ruthenica TaxID=151081 RepID=UPI00034C4261|nr:hypothetical protein [Pseudoalteromonas ruthenica]
MRTKEHYEVTWNWHQAQSSLDYMLDVYGDEIAKREGYRELQGIEAVYYYLIHKFNWLPSDVKAMKLEDIRFVLTEEMYGWTAPKDAVHDK